MTPLSGEARGEVLPGPSVSGSGPMVIVALSLLALVVLPTLQEARVRAISDEIATVLEPARDRALALALVQARQLSRFQAYLLTGESRFRVRYEALIQEEQDVHAELSALVERTELEVREPLAALYTASQRWHLSHQTALAGEVARQRYLQDLAGEQARYDRVLTASRELQSAIDTQVDRARASMTAARERQTVLTLALAGLALLGTLALAVIGRRHHRLVVEADRRRGDALRARRAMEAVLEASGDGVLGLDLEGACTRLNRTGSALLGITEHEARGRDVHALLHGRAPEHAGHDEAACPILAALRQPGEGGEAVTERDDVVWRRDGSSFPVRWHLRPMVDGREIRGAVLTLTDMTRIREAEEALRQAVRAREEVVAIVSHDLRNPLGTVSAAANLLAEIDLPPAKEREQLRIIRRATSRMERLVEDLLDVARIEAGALTVQTRPMEVRPLVEESVEMARRRGEGAGVSVSSELAPDLPPIQADPVRVEQVLSNLLGNALKFTPRGGSVRVRGDALQTEVRLSVEDTGPGIAPEDVERLFDRYWQVRGGGEEGRRKGAGLGLAIVQGIVDTHGGRVWVESEPGRGSTFHVTFPRAERARAAAGGPGEPGGRDAPEPRGR